MATFVERPVNVRTIEEDLLEIWKSAAEAGAAGEIAPVTRAAVLTLIVIVEGAEAAARATGMIAAVTEHAPCRALLVQREGGEEGPPIEAFATAHCHRVSGGRQVCCEQVTVRVRPAGERLVAGLLIPLLIPDLAVYLFWPEAARLLEEAAGGQAESGLFGDLRGVSDVTLIDSSLSRQPRALLACMAAQPRLRDLNWARLLPWREAVADLAEAADSPIRQPDRIVIEASGDPARPMARPWLLAGWLAARLGWSPEETKRLTIELTPGAGGPGRINALRFASGSRLQTLRRDDVLVHVLRPDEHLLCREIDRRGPDPVYRQSVQRAVRLAGPPDTPPRTGAVRS